MNLLIDEETGRRLVAMLRDYEATATRGGFYEPGRRDHGIVIRPARVTVKCSAATATLATSDGRANLLQIGPTGVIANYVGAPDPVVIWNGYPGEVPVGGLIWVYLYAGRWTHLTYSCP